MTHYSQQLEFLVVKYQLIYLPREFTAITIVAVNITPSTIVMRGARAA